MFKLRGLDYTARACIIHVCRAAAATCIDRPGAGRVLVRCANVQTMAKRVDLSLSEKVKLVRELEFPGVTQASVDKKYGVLTSQVSRLSKNKQD